MGRKTGSVAAFFLCALISATSSTPAASITLSDQGILTLDSNLQWYFGQTLTASIQATRDTPGPGVEFDIHFQDTQNSSDYSIFRMSDDRQGNGTLAGIDVSGFDHYDLRFTLLAIDGVSSPGTEGVITVGAAIGGGGIAYRYAPKRIGFVAGYDTTAVSSTSFDFDTIDRIGFNVWLYSGWAPGPTTVTMRVEATPGAVPIPEPASFCLLLLGGAMALGRKRWGNVSEPSHVQCRVFAADGLVTS